MPTSDSIASDLNDKASVQLQSLLSAHEHIQLSSELLTKLQILLTRSSFAATVLQRYPQIISLFSEPRFCQPLGGKRDKLYCVFSTWIATAVSEITDEKHLASELRQLRQSAMTLITYYDLVLAQPIQDSLQQVSVLADELIKASYNWHYHQLSQRYGAPKDENGRQPLCILAMGKLGGYELNFSSDIDLIFVYPRKGMTEGGKKSIENQQFFTRLAQKLIDSLDTVTADGFVYRVDMRLRPFGDSGPLVTHFDAFEDYYQQQGREWERYAMVKARVINSVDASTCALDALLQPFIYRRYIDFTALESLRSMKSLIEKEVRRKRLTENIKLGAGGIREVEFLVQSLQLIHAGKHRRLQTPELATAIQALLTHGILEQTDAQELLDDYYTLRKVEHCLQQFDNRQTQQLPANEIDQYRLLSILGYADWNVFKRDIDKVMTRINTKFKALIKTPEEHPDTNNPMYELCEDLWAIQLDQTEWLEAFDSVDATQLTDTVRLQLFASTQDLNNRLSHATQGERGQKSMGRLMPQLLFDLFSLDGQDIVTSFDRIAPILTNIAGRTAYIDLLLENHGARLQLIQLCRKSPWIANQLTRFPLLLDELLDPSYLADQSESVEAVTQRLSAQLQQSVLRIEPDDLELMMNAWRQFKLCQQMIIAAADITDHLPTNRVSDHLTALATVLVDAVVRYAWQNIKAKFGEPFGKSIDNSGLSVIAYGKFGGLELGYGSDLDLVFLYDAQSNSQTDGKRSISAQQFYVKLVQRFLHLMTTPMQLGQVYDIDLRLRPDGSSGMLCSRIDSYADYQLSQAWTWEHQALVRTRPVWGDPKVNQRFFAIRQQILSLPRDKCELRLAVSEMREKMRSHLLRKQAEHVDLKQSVGGITDIEFLVQYWLLAHANHAPAITQWSDTLRLLDIFVASDIIDIQQATNLQDCYLKLRREINRSDLQDQALVAVNADIEAVLNSVKRSYQAVLG